MIAHASAGDFMKMKEDEIDQWYEEEKQKVMDDYLKEIEDKSKKEKSEEKFHEMMSRLSWKYGHLMDKALLAKKKKKSSGKFSKILEKIPFLKRK